MVQQVAIARVCAGLLLCALAGTGPAWADGADNFAYLRASSQFDSDINPGRFHPMNLVDHDPATLWCEGKPGLGDNEQVVFYFKTPQVIDRIVLTPSAAGGRTITTLRLSDGTRSVRMALGNDANESVEEMLTTPLKGTEYVLTIEHVGAPQKDAVFPSDVSCLAEVALYHGDLLLTPSKSGRPYDDVLDRLVGEWGLEPLGASESTLVFSLDGTWTWTHEPLMGGKRSAESGTFRLRNGHLQMRKGTTGRFVTVDLRFHHVEIDPRDMGSPRGDYDTLILGDTLGKEFGGTYNNAKFN